MSNKMLPSGISVRIRENLIEGASRTQTTLIIDPIVTLSGARVLMSDIGDKGYGKIDQGNSREELISWTGITDNTTTYTLTGVVWGINFHNLTGGVAANMKRHNSGAVFSINTDMHYIAEQFVSSDDFNVNDNSLGWGDGQDNDKTLEARNGDANVPFVRYDSSENAWVASDNGVDTYKMSEGGGGLTAGHGIDINAGAIDVDITELTTDTALDVTTGQIVVKFDESTLVENSANGIKLVVIDPAETPANNINKLVKTDSNGKVVNSLLNTGVAATNIAQFDTNAKLPLGYEIVTSSYSDAGSAHAQTLDLSAPTGKVIIGGGAKIDYGYIRIDASYPLNSTTWRVSVGSYGTSNMGFSAYAICAKLS